MLTLLKPGIFKTLTEFRAAYMTPGKPRQPANAERLRELMRGAMIRNTRAVVALKLPRRHATTIRVEGGPAERAAYADLAAAVRRLAGGGRAGPQPPRAASPAGGRWLVALPRRPQRSNASPQRTAGRSGLARACRALGGARNRRAKRPP